MVLPQNKDSFKTKDKKIKDKMDKIRRHNLLRHRLVKNRDRLLGESQRDLELEKGEHTLQLR